MDTKVELEIETLVFRGYGLGRREGKVWFVPYTAPGDRIIAVPEDEKKSHVFGRLVKVLKPGPDRVEPACPHFGVCGGCHWQHLSYRAQLEAKEKILREFLGTGGRDSPGIRTAASPDIWNYRSRIQMRTDPSGRPGFFAAGSRKVIPVDNCPIAREELNRKLGELVFDNIGSGRAVTGPAGGVSGGFELFLDGSGGAGIRPLEKDRPGGTLFSQVNPRVNQLLREAIFRFAESYRNEGETPGTQRTSPSSGPPPPSPSPSPSYSPLQPPATAPAPLAVFDLFCGDGNLSLPLAPLAEIIRGWDSSPEAAAKANALAGSAGTKPRDIRYHAVPVEKASKEIKREVRRRSAEGCRVLLLADPPRRGLKGILDFIVSLDVPEMIYVSCSPPDLARDAEVLRSRGWELREAVLLDMFPQTYHMETAALFRKEQGAP